MRMAFVSRHRPTTSQQVLAADKGLAIYEVGDRDAFTIDPLEFSEYDVVAVVHPAAAARLLAAGLKVAVFKNANRAPEGQPPQFEAVGLYIYAKYGLATSAEV